MTLKETLKQLEALGNEKVRQQNRRNGAGDNQFGVKLGDIRKLAAKIKANHELALALWETGNLDARLVAVLRLIPGSCQSPIVVDIGEQISPSSSLSRCQSGPANLASRQTRTGCRQDQPHPIEMHFIELVRDDSKVKARS